MLDLAISVAINLVILAIVARLWFTFGFKRGREDRTLEDFNTQHDDWYHQGYAAGVGMGTAASAFAERYDAGWKAGFSETDGVGGDVTVNASYAAGWQAGYEAAEEKEDEAASSFKPEYNWREWKASRDRR